MPSCNEAMENVPRIGLIAGAGRFPHLVLDGAKQAGFQVVLIALRGFADPVLAGKADVVRWSGLARLGRWIRILRRHGASRVILAGSVRKTEMYDRFRLLRNLPDWTAVRLWFFQIRDKRNDTVLSAVAEEFARQGIIVDECTRFSTDHFASQGMLTRRSPTPVLLEDAAFGWRIAKEMGRLDIGQSVAVKETEVIAVEAIEGTDRMIERAGQLCPRGGWTLVKVAKPNQDRRFDVPTVGPDTISKLRAARAAMLVIEAGATVILDREKLVAEAEKAGIIVAALTSDSMRLESLP